MEPLTYVLTAATSLPNQQLPLHLFCGDWLVMVALRRKGQIEGGGCSVLYILPGIG